MAWIWFPWYKVILEFVESTLGGGCLIKVAWLVATPNIGPSVFIVNCFYEDTLLNWTHHLLGRPRVFACSLANPDSHKYELTYCNLLFGSLPPTMRVIVWGTRTFTSKVNSIPPYPRAHLNVFTGNQGYWALFRVEIIRAKGVGLVLLFLVLTPTPCMQHRHLCHPIGHCCVLSLPGSR